MVAHFRSLTDHGRPLMGLRHSTEQNDMRIEPDFGDFAARYAEGAPQTVSSVLVSDLETPVSAMLKLANERPMSFLLESVEGGAVRGRYSIIGLNPDSVWRAFGDKA